MKKLLLILMLIAGGLIGYGQKIADLPTATTIVATDLLIIDKTAATSGITIANFFGTIPSDIITGGSLRSLKTTEQLRLSYDATNYLTVTLADDGHTTFVTVDPDGEEADINFNPDGNVGIKTAAPGTALEVTGKTTTDDLRIDNLATGDVEVLSPDASGDIVTLATADIGDIAIEHSGGMTVVTTGGMMTINTGNTFEKLDEENIAYTAYHLHDFTHDDGKLTYTGTATKHFEICIHVSIEGDEAAQRVLIRLAKDGTTIAATEMPHDFKAVSTDAVISLGWLLELATGEYLEVFGTSDTSSDTFDVHNLQMIISEH